MLRHARSRELFFLKLLVELAGIEYLLSLMVERLQHEEFGHPNGHFVSASSWCFSQEFRV